MTRMLGGRVGKGVFGFGPYGSPGFEHHRNVAKAAREQPGEWVDVATRPKADTASSLLWSLKNRPSIVFQPADAFEFRRERRGDEHVVQVRFVGGQR